MTDRNIALIGFMGSGKSLASKALAERLRRPVFSTDALIEHREHATIADIFANKGEAYFRALEHEIVKDVSEKNGIIIDCGGGVVLNPEHFTLLRKHGIIIHLKTTPEIIYERVKGDHNRPLLNVPNPLGRIKELYNQRLPLYDQADMVIDSSNPSMAHVVDEILKRL